MPDPKKLIYPHLLGKDFDEAIEYIRRSSIGTPKRIYIDLSVAHQNLALDITGNFFYVIETNSVTDTFSIRFNEVREDPFNMYQNMGFYTPFYRFHITNAAQPGAFAVILYGSLARPFLDFIDNRSQALQTSILEDMLEKMNQGLPLLADTRVEASGLASNATVILHTVTAGKTFYLCGIMFDSKRTAVSTAHMAVRNAADVEQYRLLQPHAPAANEFISEGGVGFHCAVPIPAGWDIYLVSAAATQSIGAFIYGYEV